MRGRGAFCNQESESAFDVAVWLVVIAQYAVQDIPFRRTTVPERQRIATSEHARTRMHTSSAHILSTMMMMLVVKVAMWLRSEKCTRVCTFLAQAAYI